MGCILKGATLIPAQFSLLTGLYHCRRKSNLKRNSHPPFHAKGQVADIKCRLPETNKTCAISDAIRRGHLRNALTPGFNMRAEPLINFFAWLVARCAFRWAGRWRLKACALCVEAHIVTRGRALMESSLLHPALVPREIWNRIHFPLRAGMPRLTGESLFSAFSSPILRKTCRSRFAAPGRMLFSL